MFVIKIDDGTYVNKKMVGHGLYNFTTENKVGAVRFKTEEDAQAYIDTFKMNDYAEIETAEMEYSRMAMAITVNSGTIIIH